jgi:hypothetical protein
MPTFLFWNIHRKQITELVARVAHAHAVDILILAESEIPSSTLLLSLNRDGASYQLPLGFCKRIQVFTRFHAGFLQAVAEDDWTSIRRLNLPGQPEILLAMAHLPSGLHSSAESRSFACVELANMIRAEESRAGHSRTVLVGDLNLNPFDDGLVAATALNAVMTRELASRGTRTVLKKKYAYFYNPMWGHFGDRHGGSGGTYYYDRSEHVAYYWHLYDQVLIRPSLISGFRQDELKILTAASEVNLIDSRGRPDQVVGSDHLPVLFRLNSAAEASHGVPIAQSVA